MNERGSQMINETLAKDQRHTRKGLTAPLIELTCWTSQVRVRIQLECLYFSLLFISSDCCSRTDVQVAVVNGKVNFSGVSVGSFSEQRLVIEPMVRAILLGYVVKRK